MTQYEYKVVKCRVCDQNFYTSWLATYGWQVQNVQEFVDQVVNQSIGFSSNMGSGSMFGNAYFHPHSNSAHLSGYQTNHSWGSQMNTTVTNVKTKLSITFFRDVAIPNRADLINFENRWWAASDKFMNRLLSVSNAKGQKEWPEFKALEVIDQEARAFIRDHKSQPKTAAIETTKPVEQKPKQIENNPLQIPNAPASATIKSIAVTHNFIQSGQAGIQIRMAFTLQHRKGLSCGILAYFYDENRIGLVDINQRYKTTDGHVSLGSSFTAEFDDVLVNDYILFMPYAELDQPDGNRKLTLNVQIYDDSGKTFIAKSEFYSFIFSKNGSSMHGETISEDLQPTQKTASVTTRQVTRRTKPAAGETKPPKPATKPVKMNNKEFERVFIKNAGWTEITEDRRLFLDGFLLNRDQKYAEAEVKYQNALALNPKEALYWSSLSDCLANQSKMNECIQNLEKGLQEIPGNTKLLFNLGFRYACINEFQKAEDFASYLEKDESKDAKYLMCMIRALCAELQKDYKKAIHLYDQADSYLDDANPQKGYYQQRCREEMKYKKNKG